jgi:hypothetical protein
VAGVELRRDRAQLQFLAVCDSCREDWNMTRNRWLLVLIGLIGGVLISGRIALLAQDGDAGTRKAAPPAVRQEGPAEGLRLPAIRLPAESSARDATNPGSIQDALLRSYHFPFSKPTPLFQVCAHLKETLKGAVVLDLAALGRQDVEPEDPVQLELDGVRLKTGLKLLLDQVGLTYRVVAEDNLMIITDREGSDDSDDRIWSELRALHRDLHALQDDVDELRDYLGDDREGGRVRKPTIIEELPELEGQKPANAPDKPGNSQRKPGADAPAAGARQGPARIPLSGPRRRPKS